MRKHLILTVTLLSLAALSSYAQKTTTMEYNRERVYTTETKVKKVWYQGELTFGYAYSGSLNAKVTGDDGTVDSWKVKRGLNQASVTTIHGIRITQWFFLGLGGTFIASFPEKVGYLEEGNFCYENDGRKNKLYHNDKVIHEEDNGDMRIPVFLNVKGYYPVTDRFSLYVTASAGISIPVAGYLSWNNLYYGEYGLGLNYRKFNFSLGVQQNSGWYEERENYCSFFAKLGLKW